MNVNGKCMEGVGAKAKQDAEVTLDGGKVVRLKIPRVEHSETAALRAGDSADATNNMAHFGLVQQKELLKISLVSVDGKAYAKEPISDILSVVEYNEVVKVIGKLGGQTGKRKEPVIKFVS